MENRNIAGFTYIELLVVITILAITASFVTLVVGDFGESRKLRVEARQLKALMSLAAFQAMLTGQALGLEVTSKGYHFKRYDEFKQAWQTLPNKTFSLQAWPPQTQYQLSPATPNTANQPQIVLFPSGELTEFKLNLQRESQQLTITGSRNGEINIL